METPDTEHQAPALEMSCAICGEDFMWLLGTEDDGELCPACRAEADTREPRD